VTLDRTLPNGEIVRVNFDNASKLLAMGSPHDRVAAVTFGRGTIGGRTAHSLMPEFQQTIEPQRLQVSEYAQAMGEFLTKRWISAGEQGNRLYLIVGGVDEGSSYGEVHRITIPDVPKPVEQYPGGFGMAWGGQLEIVNRIVQGFDPQLLSLISGFDKENTIDISELQNHLRANLAFTIPYGSLPLQDCVDLAAFLIRTTMVAQNLSVGLRGVGGTIEIATITPTEGLQWVQKRQIHGERT
jgi:hypothetical protein